MVERVRCPRCSTVFPTSAGLRCPHCGLSGRVRSPAEPAPSAPTRSARSARPEPRPPTDRRGRRRDHGVAAVAVVVLLLMAGIVTALVLDGPEPAPAHPTAGLAGVGQGTASGSGSGADDGNTSTPPARLDPLTPNTTVGGSGPEGDAPPLLLFKGGGDDVTDAFTTEQGLLRVTMTYHGDGFFRAAFINLDDANATRRSLLAPQGDYEGNRYVGLAPGRYIIDVTSGDDAAAWSLTVEQPRAASPGPVPQQATGRGDVASLAVEMEGEVTFRVAHSAPVGEFVVRLYDAHGNLVRRGDSEAVVSAYGDHNGSVRIALPAAGVYFVDVQATGDWSVQVS